MALRRFMFMSPEGFADTAALSDSLQLGGLTVTGAATFNNSVQIDGQLVFKAGTASLDANGVAFMNLGNTEVDGAATFNSDVTMKMALDVTGAVTSGSTFSGTKFTGTGAGGVSFDASGQKIINVATPTVSSDAANMAYVDSKVAMVTSGLSFKDSVRVKTTGNINLSAPGAAIDGVTLANGDRVLVDLQTTTTQNGIYVFNGSAAAMTRAADFDQSAEIRPGAFVFVAEGSTYADTAWVMTTDGTVTPGSSAITFTQFASVGQLTAMNGVEKPTPNQIQVKAYAGITADANGVGVDISGTNPGLEMSTAGAAGKLQVKVANANGTTRNASGVAIQLASASSNGLELLAGGLSAKVNNNGGIMMDASGLGVNLATAPGLTKTAGLAVQANNTGGIMVDASGVAVNLAATNPGLTKTAGLAVQTNTAGGMTIDASGLKPNLDSQSLEAISNAVRVKTDTTAATGCIIRTATGITVQLEATNPTLQIATNRLGVKVANGLQATASGLEVKPVTDQTSVSASGVGVVGVPSAFKINGVATNASVSAANLNTLTAGSASNADALHTHAAANQTRSIVNSYTVGSGGVTAGDPVYFSAANTVSKADASTDSTCFIIGLAKTTVAAAGTVEVVTAGVCPIAGLTAGARYYLNAGGGITAANTLPGSGKRVIYVGNADDTGELFVRIQDMGRQP